ncbi:TetR/AcrR family transcriptional regulator [Anabaena sp. FACHB-709]|uniref:Transcriptional regulator n=2 Tax=Nostocaceae TaxID=1162 RepID=A0A1Z4KK35_ANAVA|nr:MULTISPECIES: TetR/AcrR family transcriptional regulator [Nostocaceae]BAY69273.1 transcriptional regulator [Trichormus variabilis NIES-23]HBW30772.1 TetR/AcrR family transcriptional regulator [Nostoc sp. UBA8866]MBD2174703.1 TetR/AcrR family transcriptional regulator [Anabaena cylindrica FACHB-318]MBD2266464.1 TetR/AcrR family transcriptional regulator [Anabaena sp. FACHB-709]MBD2275876.1 TetR/AcrR family transcriptional regulator [Nostoc sp. PCC 7120 = FACHB-418]
MPKIVDHDQYRKELLSKCFDLFAEKGYGSITMRQIAQGLNVSTGTLYHYFPSKQTLFEQLVEEISQQDVSAALAEMDGAKTIEEAMTALGRYLIKHEDYCIKWTYVWVDFCQSQDVEEVQKNIVFKRVNQRYQQAVCDFLGIQDTVIATFVLSLINGLILEKLWCNQTIDFQEQCALLGKMLTLYLKNNQTNKMANSYLN